jgi:hypothetical protein
MERQQIKIDGEAWEIVEEYQGLFNLMSKAYNLILTISEMDEIITEAQKVVTKNSHKWKQK